MESVKNLQEKIMVTFKLFRYSEQLSSFKYQEIILLQNRRIIKICAIIHHVLVYWDEKYGYSSYAICCLKNATICTVFNGHTIQLEIFFILKYIIYLFNFSKIL